MTIHRPYLLWPGGKSHIISALRAFLPPGRRLIEPFVGAGSVFLNTDYPEYLLGDVNHDLILTHQTLQENGEDFIDACRELFTTDNNTPERYYELRDEFNDTQDPWRRTTLFVYLNRHGIHGLTRYNRRGHFNTSFGYRRRVYFPETEMLLFAEHAKRATFIHADFRDLMSEARPGDVVYSIAGALGRETQAYRKVWDAVGSGDWSQVEKVLRKAESQSEGAKKQRISKLKSYMEKNWEGIVSDGDVVSLGTIEGQVFHHVARRMKRHGARWSKSGADALVRLVAARSNQEPLRVRRLSRFEVQPNELANGKQVNEAELTRHAREAVRWLERQMPALVGPHADRPWVKYVLREPSRISFTVA